ncbi:hypothetical protein C7212DRAFT_362845 [Tuber magnatum]|uniref:Uncharacterized protein n=1 Tax=Tuber magnatum TaxID=42249 RepID=A0A317SRS5_9PEZI|nr:hypothetical protein C7212DRAFT_362845 [Tuber magnatum]
MSATSGVIGEPSCGHSTTADMHKTPPQPTRPTPLTTGRLARNDMYVSGGEPSAPLRSAEACSTDPIEQEDQTEYPGLQVGLEPEPDLQNALKGIPDKHVHNFTTADHVLAIIQEIQSSQSDLYCPYLAFLNTSRDGLHTFDSVQAAGIRKRYFESIHLLVIKLPSGPHETVTAAIRNCLTRSAVLMGGVDRELSDTGSKTYKPTRTFYSDSCKEGDDGILPHLRRPGPGGWPTLIFESGVSESLERLRQDARWWLEQNNHSVHAVVVTHISCNERIIDLEVWRIEPIQHPRPATRSNTLHGPRGDHRLHIDCSTTPATTTGTVPFFVITFENLVLRPKAGNEADFCLTQQDVEYIATVFRANL